MAFGDILETASGIGTTSVSATYASLAVDNLAVITLATRNATEDFTLTAGNVDGGQISLDNSGGGSIVMYFRVVQASEPLTYTFTSSNSRDVLILAEYDGATNGFKAAASVKGTGSTDVQTVVVSTISAAPHTVVSGSLLVGCVGTGGGQGSLSVSSSDGTATRARGWTEELEANNGSGGGGVRGMMASAVVSSSGTAGWTMALTTANECSIISQEFLEDVAGGQTIAVGTLAETGALGSASPIKTVQVGVLAESNMLIAIAPEKTADIGTLAETDALVTVAVVQAGEQNIAVGVLPETDGLIVIDPAKTATVGTLASFDSLIAVEAEKPIITAVGVIAEAEALIGAQARKVAPVGTLPSFDSFIAIEAVKPIFVTVGVLAATETLIAIEVEKIAPVGTLTETGSLIPVQARKVAPIGVLAELEALIGITPQQPIVVSVGTLIETDTLVAIAAVIAGVGWWSPDAVGHASALVVFTRSPAGFTKNVPSGPGPG